ncbi:hypothetical protein [Lacisediminimonas sp.]|uniref:hypothetical protein n=1 Tax=Lacisediminimonas sp. TaxID=3060582 RepID=UPI00271E62C5|nr:hypothetical protein [Lacisediminimonas sp.]MDO8301048.1 hypothetical protein [Lacisediminimonas sp.]MDO9216347.1 hypothetical protein [Lacisediminimonas sp.]
MKTYHRIAAGLIAGAALILAAGPSAAAAIDVNVVLPGVYAPRPVYVQPMYENDWRERQARALAWRDNPQNHGQVVSAAAHARNDDRKDGKSKGHGKNKGHGKSNGKHGK